MRPVERAWVGLWNSSPIRAARSAAPVRRLLDAPPIRGAEHRRRRWIARREAARHPDLFGELETVCLFVGHVKSGGTLLGAMLDAHPEAVLADEVDVLDHLALGFSREELLHVLVRNTRREALKGRITARRLGGYSVAIPGQWQGRHRVVRLVGESRAGPTTRRLGADPRHLQALRSFAAPARLRFIHVVRNPLDPIGAMVKRGGRSVGEASADYAAQAVRLERLRSWLTAEDILTVHYEDLVEAPAATLQTVIHDLGLESSPAHVSACAGLVDRHFPAERELADWSPGRLQEIRRLVDSHAFLARYRDEIVVGSGSVGA